MDRKTKTTKWSVLTTFYLILFPFHQFNFVQPFFHLIYQFSGDWVGIKLDEPVGSSDGTDRGVQLFDCTGPKYGHFLPVNAEWSSAISTGDYPPVDPFNMDEI